MKGTIGLLQQLLRLQCPAIGQHAAAAAVSLPCLFRRHWLVAVPAVMDVFCWLLLGPQGQLGALPSPTYTDKRPKQGMRYIRSKQQLGSGCELLMVL
jgi:hypothetical protein